MSRHHRPYNNYYQNNKPEDQVTNTVIKEDDEVTIQADPVVDPEPEVLKPVIGVVCDCQALNVRKQPTKMSAVLAVINSGDEVEIIEGAEENWGDFYKVCTQTGIEGFCMKQFIAIKQ